MKKRIRARDLKRQAKALLDQGGSKLDQVQVILDGIMDMLEDVEENGLDLSVEVFGKQMPVKLNARPKDDEE